MPISQDSAHAFCPDETAYENIALEQFDSKIETLQSLRAVWTSPEGEPVVIGVAEPVAGDQWMVRIAGDSDTPYAEKFSDVYFENSDTIKKIFWVMANIQNTRRIEKTWQTGLAAIRDSL